MNVLRSIIEIGSCFLELALAVYFFSSFSEKRFSRKTTITIFLGCSLAYGGAIKLIDVQNYVFLISILATLAVAFCFKFKWFSAVYMAIIFSVISGLSELIVMQMLTRGVKNFDEVISNIYVYIGALFAAKTITYLITLIIRKKKFKSFQSYKGMHFLGLLLLPCSTVAISMVFSYVFREKGISDFRGVMFLFALALLLASNVMTFYIVDKQYELISTKEKLKTSEVLLMNQKQYYEDIFKSQQEIRKTRHDLKNIFIALLGELNAGNVNESKCLIRDKLDELDQGLDISTDVDNMIDAIIYSKISKAQKFGITLEIKKNIDRPIKIDNLDFAVLLANILDNAIEAADAVGDNKEVVLSLVSNNDNLIIVCENPTVNTFSAGDIKTTKKDKKHHGFGIMSIKSVAEKYDGTYIMKCENGKATATVILTNNCRISI